MDLLGPIDFPDFPYNEKEPICVQLYHGMNLWLYEHRNHRLVEKYHMRYINKCVPRCYHESLKKFFDLKIDQLKSYDSRPIDPSLLRKEELMDLRFFEHYARWHHVRSLPKIQFNRFVQVKTFEPVEEEYSDEEESGDEEQDLEVECQVSESVEEPEQEEQEQIHPLKSILNVTKERHEGIHPWAIYEFSEEINFEE